jgi:hypothetical protein
MTVEPIQDSPIDRSDVSKLTNDQLTALVSDIRKRRDKPIKVYLELQDDMIKRRVAGLIPKLDKNYEMLGKELDQLSRLEAKLTKRVNNIMGLRLQLEAYEEGET